MLVSTALLAGCAAKRPPPTTAQPLSLAVAGDVDVEKLDDRVRSFSQRSAAQSEQDARDRTEVVRDYERDCIEGQSGACYELAVLVYLGEGVEVDDALAARLHRTACEGGTAEGCAFLSHLYARGIGVERSSERATHYRRLACELGYRGLCRHLPGAPTAAEDDREPSLLAPVERAEEPILSLDASW